MTSKNIFFILGFWVELPQILGLGFSVRMVLFVLKFYAIVVCLVKMLSQDNLKYPCHKNRYAYR